MIFYVVANFFSFGYVKILIQVSLLIDHSVDNSLLCIVCVSYLTSSGRVEKLCTIFMTALELF